MLQYSNDLDETVEGFRALRQVSYPIFVNTVTEDTLNVMNSSGDQRNQCAYQVIKNVG